MHEELQTAISSGKIQPQAAETLEKLQPGDFGTHKSWGFGQVAEWNLLAGQIRIDFKTKKGHVMQAQYAAETVRPIPPDHLLARIANNPESVLAEAKEDPVDLIRQILTDHGGKATADQIQTLLVPEVFPADAYKKWWESAKKKLRADGHFALPSKKSDPLVMRDAPIDKTVELLTAFRAARQLKQQIVAAEQISKAFSTFEKNQDALVELVTKLDEVARKNLRLNPAETLELLFVRDDIIEQAEGLSSREGALTPPDVLRSAAASLAELFEELPAAKQRRALAALPDTFGDDWNVAAARLMNRSQSRLIGEIARLFETAGRAEELDTLLRRSIADRSLTAEALHWLARERTQRPSFVKPDLFGAILHALEQNHMDSDKRSSRLHDLVLEDRELISDMLQDAPMETVRNTMRKLLQSPVFEELNKRSLLARIVKLHPEMEALIGGDDSQQQEALTVSWASLERRKKEYDELVNKQIPQNTRDLSIARSYGDLRENFEFKSAKEMQSVLMRRKAEIELQLALARGTNFENPDTSSVSIGTTAAIQNIETGEVERYHILGAWDGAPEHHVVSYQATIGQALLGRKAGDEVELPTETGTKKVRITEITPFVNLELLA